MLQGCSDEDDPASSSPSHNADDAGGDTLLPDTTTPDSAIADTQPEEVDTRPTGPTITLQGVVTDAASNTPLAQAQVCVDERCTQTDAEGAYRLGDVPSDQRIVVTVTAEGYGPGVAPLDTGAEDMEVRPLSLLELGLLELQETALGVETKPHRH
ncbi:MAG: carboxypeptidase regulatory-like domain-containing protein [Myxococcota bacterium]